MQLEKLEIHKVFLRFSNFYLWQNLSPSALADLIRASLKLDKRATPGDTHQMASPGGQCRQLKRNCITLQHGNTEAKSAYCFPKSKAPVILSEHSVSECKYPAAGGSPTIAHASRRIFAVRIGTVRKSVRRSFDCVCACGSDDPQDDKIFEICQPVRRFPLFLKPATLPPGGRLWVLLFGFFIAMTWSGGGWAQIIKFSL